MAGDGVGGHPTVNGQDAHVVFEAWEDLRLNADRLDEVRCRLLAHADWALISQRVARHVDAELTGDSAHPDVDTLTAWAHIAAQELGRGAGGGGVEK